jgi:hypothetical protein
MLTLTRCAQQLVPDSWWDTDGRQVCLEALAHLGRWVGVVRESLICRSEAMEVCRWQRGSGGRMEPHQQSPRMLRQTLHMEQLDSGAVVVRSAVRGRTD